jgi:DNA polymerase III epsilon subunit-like protein
MSQNFTIKGKTFKNIVFHDTETTGVEPEDRIIESAYMHFNGKGSLKFLEELNKAPVKIKPAAAMTHGYTNKMVEGKPTFDKTKGAKFLKDKSNDGKTYYIAHNAPFDIGMLSKEGIDWDPDFIIDTLQVAKHVYREREDIEMFKLQYFRYFFEYDDQEWYQDAMDIVGLDEIKPHTAMSDIFILWLFYANLQWEFGLTNQDMVRLSQTPAEEKYLNFGNIFEKGVLTYEEVVRASYQQYGKEKRGYDYLDWAVNNMNMSIDRDFAINKAMAYGVLKGFIPDAYKYKTYLYWGILYVFNSEEISDALKKLNQKEDFRNYILETSIKKFEAYKDSLPEDFTAEEEQELKKKKFMNNFVVKYRSHIVKGDK